MSTRKSCQPFAALNVAAIVDPDNASQSDHRRHRKPASEADFPSTEQASIDKREVSTPGDDVPVPVAPVVGEDNLDDYPKSWRLVLISIALCLAVFCVALDNTIIATALPKITDTFEALNDVGKRLLFARKRARLTV